MAKYEEIKQGTIFPAGVLNPYGESSLAIRI